MSRMLLDSNEEVPGESAVWGFRVFGALIVASFNPRTGKYLRTSFKSDYLGILHSEFEGKERGNTKLIKQRVQARFQEWRNCHQLGGLCPPLYDLVLGEDAGTTRAYYLPMIRAYIVYKQYISRDISSYSSGDFDVMNYCPFCGTKFPERLDNKLTEILQNEYGLSSWRDYKKAPKEFHSDEWWKKRGL